MPSALEIAGSAHRATSPAFKLHAALACVQIALVTWICRAADIWRSKRTSEQFPGHLGPSVFIAAIGITALTAEWPWRTRAAIEGKLSMWGGGSYVAGEAVNRLLEGVHQSALKHYLDMGCTRGCRSSSFVWIGLPAPARRAAPGRAGAARVVRERVCLASPSQRYAIAATEHGGLVYLGAQAAEQLWRGGLLHVDLIAMGARCACLGSGTGRRARPARAPSRPPLRGVMG